MLLLLDLLVLLECNNLKAHISLLRHVLFVRNELDGIRTKKASLILHLCYRTPSVL
jgi:hypothetical protein